MFYQCITPYNPFQRAVTLLIMPVIGWTLSVFIVDLNYVDHIRIIIVKDILCIMCMYGANYLSIAQTVQEKKNNYNIRLWENPQSYSVQEAALQCGRTHL